MRWLFQYYIVLRICWPIWMFHGIGVFALVFFAQGQDVLRELTLNTRFPVDFRHGVLAFLASLWWGWQSWRAGRMLLHFSNFSFWNYKALYILRAQVLLPRIMGILSPLIMAWGIYRSKAHVDPLVLLHLSGAFWLYVFFHFRRQIIVWIRSRRKGFLDLIPAYIPVKNASYPARFIWKKQRIWIWIRILVLSAFFGAVFLYPVVFPQWMGATSIILTAFGFWLVVLSMFTIFEHYIHVPLIFAFILLAFVFSFFNNNHEIRKIQEPVMTKRPDLESYFLEWCARRITKGDTLPIVLIASEGGGMRSAYWTTQILSHIQKENPEFSNHIFALTGVSGGALGVSLSAGAFYGSGSKDNRAEQLASFCREDFLAPVTAFAVYPDLLQRFLPVPIEDFDRARALEMSWEQAWNRHLPKEKQGFLSNGFLSQLSPKKDAKMPVIILNTTHVESGSRVLISNVQLPEGQFYNAYQLFDITGQDIPISTALSCSARFPFITPPASVSNKNGTRWGHLVDGGYFENMGSATLLETYFSIKQVAEKYKLPVSFVLVMLRNTLSNPEVSALPGFYEIAAPPYTFARIWQKSGLLGIKTTESFMLDPSDRILNVKLDRKNGDLLPLGWSLSRNAVRLMEMQTAQKSMELIDIFD